METVEQPIGAGLTDTATMRPAVEAEPVAEEPWWKRLLTAETGEGEIDAYRSHPLNWDGSLEVARLLRGLTGMLGNLRLAIVDVAFAIVKLATRRGAAAGAGEPK